MALLREKCRVVPLKSFSVSFKFNLKCMDEVNGFSLEPKIKKEVQSVFFEFFCVSIPRVQTGTILSCICCIWDSIPCALLRILSWCAAEEIPILAMSLFQTHKTRGGWEHVFLTTKFAFNLILPEHLNAKVEVFNAWLASARECDYWTHQRWVSFPCISQKYAWSQRTHIS